MHMEIILQRILRVTSKKGGKMKGSVVLGLKEMVTSRFGRDKWDIALKKAGAELKTVLAVSDVDDAMVLRVINSLCEILNIKLPELADLFGDYWINVYTQRTYPTFYFRSKTAREFLLDVDRIHVELTKTIPNARPPRFEYEWKNDNTLIMRYKSHRGLIDIVVGLVKGVGKRYKENLRVSKLGNDRVEIIFEGKNG